jgi:hypothetical protein
MGLTDFEKGYLIAALWSTSDDDGEPLDQNYSIEDVEPGILSEIKKDCNLFVKQNEVILNMVCDKYNYSEEQAGHDFWLTRNGHGVGFLDREIGKYGDLLYKAAKSWGGSDVYVGDDGKLYFSNLELHKKEIKIRFFK